MDVTDHEQNVHLTYSNKFYDATIFITHYSDYDDLVDRKSVV